MIGSYKREGPLTPRTYDVLRGAAQGETARETAARLHVQPVTVEKYRRVALARLGARSMPQAVYLAARQGLLDE